MHRIEFPLSSLHSRRGNVWSCLCVLVIVSWYCDPGADSEMVTGEAHEGSLYFLLAFMNVVIERSVW